MEKTRSSLTRSDLPHFPGLPSSSRRGLAGGQEVEPDLVQGPRAPAEP